MLLWQGVDIPKAGRIARDIDCFMTLVSSCSNLPNVAEAELCRSVSPVDDIISVGSSGTPQPGTVGSGSGSAGSSGSAGLLDRPALEEVLHEVRSTADGYNKALFARVLQIASNSGPSVLPVDSFSIWHIQVILIGGWHGGISAVV